MARNWAAVGVVYPTAVAGVLVIAPFISVSTPQPLGSAFATVSAPPDISVTSVTGDLVDTDSSLVDREVFQVTTTDENPRGAIYFVVRDAADIVLHAFSNALPTGAGEFDYNLNLADLPAEDIASVAVTVVP